MSLNRHVEPDRRGDQDDIDLYGGMVTQAISDEPFFGGGDVASDTNETLQQRSSSLSDISLFSRQSPLLGRANTIASLVHR